MTNAPQYLQEMRTMPLRVLDLDDKVTLRDAEKVVEAGSARASERECEGVAYLSLATTRTRTTFPETGDDTCCSIFMALLVMGRSAKHSAALPAQNTHERTRSGSPALTSWPSLTRTSTTTADTGRFESVSDSVGDPTVGTHWDCRWIRGRTSPSRGGRSRSRPSCPRPGRPASRR